MDNLESILIPINEDFLEVFEILMDDNQKKKIRANNVRQYLEGVIDLLLRDVIEKNIKENERYDGINWGRKIKIISKNYDEKIADDIQEAFRIGGDGSHFNGKVKDAELQEIIDIATHIVERIFIKYFCNPEHRFGSENVLTIFSMLPLNNRIYIMENVFDKYQNKYIIDKLSLAYYKNGDLDKAKSFLLTCKLQKKITEKAYNNQLQKLKALELGLQKAYEKNANYAEHPERLVAVPSNNQWVLAFPTNKDIFEMKKSFEVFNNWFQEDKDKYPEFLNLFFCLMSTDTRRYI